MRSGFRRMRACDLLISPSAAMSTAICKAAWAVRFPVRVWSMYSLPRELQEPTSTGNRKQLGILPCWMVNLSCSKVRPPYHYASRCSTFAQLDKKYAKKHLLRAEELDVLHVRVMVLQLVAHLLQLLEYARHHLLQRWQVAAVRLASFDRQLLGRPDARHDILSREGPGLTGASTGKHGEGMRGGPGPRPEHSPGTLHRNPPRRCYNKLSETQRFTCFTRSISLDN